MGSYRILVAEDNDDQASLLQYFLTRAGYASERVKTGVEAVHRLRQTTPPDLFITDIGLPGLTGYDVIRQLQQDGVYVPTLILSSHPKEDWLKVEDPIIDYIRKPFSPSEFLKYLQTYFSKVEAGESVD